MLHPSIYMIYKNANPCTSELHCLLQSTETNEAMHTNTLLYLLILLLYLFTVTIAQLADVAMGRTSM